MLQSLLGSVTINVLEYGYKIGLDWLGKFAQAIIEGCGIIGLGIIVFTIVLKCITLPFDIYQRVNMRKQNLVMQEMQPELEKLQKQYANDKATYNQKMMQLYKKNGYSMLGACLPTIFSLVILIVAFQGFRTYSQFANLSMYEKMSQVYTESVLKYAPDSIDFDGQGRNYLLFVENAADENLSEGKAVWEEGRVIEGSLINEKLSHLTYKMLPREKNEETGEYGNKYLEVRSSKAEQFIVCKSWFEDDKIKFSFFVDTEKTEGKNKFDTYLEEYGETLFLQKEAKEGEEPLTVSKVYNAIREEVVADTTIAAEETDNVAINRYVVRIGATAAAEWYRGGHDSSFLWVKNVWYPDVSYSHPIQSYNKFKSELNKKITLQDGTKKSLTQVFTKTDYDNLVSQLDTERSQPNGYFILIILSIGFMVLSQFISMRSSKTSNKYQTVDGQGARTQKIMLFIMPVIYAIFAFMYSAAFSIYMTMSSVISLLTTLLANLIIGAVFKKKSAKKATERVTRKYAWQMTEKEKRAKEKEAQKEAKRNERANRFKRK